MIEWSNHHPSLMLHRVSIDVDAVIRDALAADMAGAEEWIALWRQGRGAAPYLDLTPGGPGGERGLDGEPWKR